MTYRSQGIIIRKKNYRDADRLFAVYTFDRGKVQAIAQGTRKIESKLAGSLELLNHCTFTFAKGKILDRIATVDVHQTFEPIKGDLFALSAALHGIALFDESVRWDLRDEPLFLLLLDFLESIQEGTKQAHFPAAVAVFSRKLSAQLGYGEEPFPLENELSSRAYFDLLFKEKVSAPC